MKKKVFAFFMAMVMTLSLVAAAAAAMPAAMTPITPTTAAMPRRP